MRCPCAGIGPIDAVAAGAGHTCALRADGTLACSGGNGHGQCNVPADIGPIDAVAAGNWHTCALRADGTLVCFGDNRHGQCDIPAGIGPIDAVAAGNWHTGALRADGKLVCFGYNRYGQCDVPAGIGPINASWFASGNRFGQCNVPAGIGPIDTVRYNPTPPAWQRLDAKPVLSVRGDGPYMIYAMSTQAVILREQFQLNFSEPQYCWMRTRWMEAPEGERPKAFAWVLSKRVYPGAAGYLCEVVEWQRNPDSTWDAAVRKTPAFSLEESYPESVPGFPGASPLNVGYIQLVPRHQDVDERSVESYSCEAEGSEEERV